MGWEVRDDHGLGSMVPDEYGAGNMCTMTQNYGSSIKIPGVAYGASLRYPCVAYRASQNECIDFSAYSTLNSQRISHISSTQRTRHIQQRTYLTTTTTLLMPLPP